MQQVAKRGELDYIPFDLEDCFSHLKLILTPDDLKDIRNKTEENMCSFHFNFGMALRNKWGLWKGSRLALWFNTLGITHADDMTGIIFTSFWRHLNNQPIRLEEQVRFYLNYWRAHQ